MSVQALAWVIERCEATLGTRCLMFAIANHADKNGEGCWASVDTLAHEARLSRKGCQKGLRRLEADGWIAGAGLSTYGTTIYRIVAMGGEPSTPQGGEPEGRGGEPEGAKGANFEAKTRARGSPKPSLEPTNGKPSGTVSGADAPDPEVERLCSLLEEKVNEIAESPGRSRVIQRWRQEVERLIRIDGRSPKQVEYVIGWLGGPTEGGQFWAANIQSGPKLRAKFDQLVARIKAESQSRNGRRGAGPSSDDLRRKAAALREQGL